MPARPPCPWRGPLVGSLLLITGCSTARDVWKEPPAGILKEMMLARDHVVLEIALVTVPDSQLDTTEAIWRDFDEQVLPVETRRHLNRNGFRVGIVGLTLPDALRTMVNVPEDPAAGLAALAASSPASEEWTNRRLRARMNHRNEIVTFPNREGITYFLADGAAVSGRTLAQAETLFAARVLEGAGGSVNLEMTPEIRHGPNRQRYAVRDGGFRLEAAHDQQVISPLRFVAQLAPGHTLMIAADGPASSLGSVFFHANNVRKLLLIRLAVSQDEPLFETP